MGRGTCVLFEDAGKMTLGGKAQIYPNSGCGFIRIAEEAFCLLCFCFQNKVCQALTGLFNKLPGQIRAAEVQKFRYVLGGYGFGEMMLGIVGNLYGQLRRILS